MLKIDHLHVVYGESLILRDVNLEVAKGRVVCLIGRNGVGKTTLLKSIMGLLIPKSGEVLYNGEDITDRRPDERSLQGIGYVPQGREIFPQLTVRENLVLGLAARGEKSRSVPEEVYELFPALKDLLGRRGGDLSGGQQQQLAIGRVLVLRPQLLLLDEPTEGIQPSIIDEIEDAIHRIKKSGVSILLVEQYLQFAWRLADEYYVMEKGTIISKGSTESLSEEDVKHHLTV
ncbi:MAG: urea ABC transporter ATP-binding subunit UrtE [Nitrospira sp.]|nr:urea ABC transporter ATP-binding subunit UrtE [Candidatus Manganitrophaceae bacterium]HIL35098.1 urea ABC transporter ATP-binding subunit UrtE [Candidatus Manganitrophaceae bacterium]